MVQAYHVVLTAYGFWLPNDPRGSGSEFVGAPKLYAFGPATTVASRVSVANRPHDRDLRLRAKTALAHPPVRLTGIQARAVARGFAFSVRRDSLRVFACAIMPDHAHLVIERSAQSIESVIAKLKSDASRQLLAEQLHPFEHSRTPRGTLPSVWAARSWRVYLATHEAVLARICYVEQNPVKAGLRAQRWSFVVPYVGTKRT